MTASESDDRARSGALLIGIGNPDRGDDGVGPAVVARLRPRLSDDVAVVSPSDGGPGLLEHWGGRRLVIAIDAGRRSGPMGRIRRFEFARGRAPDVPRDPSTHGLSLPETYRLAEALGRAPPRLVLFTVEGGGFEPGAELGPAVAAAVGSAANRVLAELLRAGFGRGSRA